MTAVVPAFNAERYLRDALDSIVGQTYPNIEVLVVDNASTDATADIIRSYGDKVVYLYEAKKGPAAARNKGLAHANGHLISFLDSDDEWLPDKTERQVEFMLEHPEYGFCYSHYEYIDQDGRPYQPTYAKDCSRNGWVFEDLLRYELQIGIGTTMVRRHCAEKAGGFNERLMTAEDTDFFIRVAKYCQFGYIPGPVARYRSHAGSLTKQQGIPRGTFKALDYLVERYPELAPSRSPLMRYAYATRYCARGVGAFYRGDHAEMRRHALKAIKYRPYHMRAWYYLVASLVPAPLIRLARTLKR